MGRTRLFDLLRRARSPASRSVVGSWTTLLLIHELDSSWTFHSLGAPGVQLTKADMVALVQAILERAR